MVGFMVGFMVEFLVGLGVGFLVGLVVEFLDRWGFFFSGCNKIVRSDVKLGVETPSRREGGKRAQQHWLAGAGGCNPSPPCQPQPHPLHSLETTKPRGASACQQQQHTGTRTHHRPGAGAVRTRLGDPNRLLPVLHFSENPGAGEVNVCGVGEGAPHLVSEEREMVPEENAAARPRGES